MKTMSTIEENLKNVHQRICTIAQNYGRSLHHITLLAVSKTKSVTAIEEAITAGQRAFGENYVQEGVKKIIWFRDNSNVSGLIWHFIGSLQSNKSRLVAEYFDWCHTIDRPQLARRLNAQRSMQRSPLNVLIQINISGESTKAGILSEHILSLAAIIENCPRLQLRGLMAIPAPESNFQRQLVVFKRMHELYESLKQVYTNVDTLSLGTTNDMSAAIAAGSTMVRIGTAIFGSRGYDSLCYFE